MTDKEIRSGEDLLLQKRADEALASSLSLLKATMESTADGILVVDLSGRITLWNHKFSDMWQIPEELLSKRLDEPVFNYVLQQLAQPETFLGKVRELYGQPEESSNDQLDLADGRIFERYSQPQRIGDEVVGRVWSFFDITERKQAEEETQRERAFFDRLVETAPEGIAIADPQGRVMRVNAEFVRMFGYGADEAVGQYLDDLVAPPARQEEARAITRSTGKGETELLETVRRRKDGTLVDVSLIGAPILVAGKLEAVYGIYRDITERKQAEEETEHERAFFDRLVEATPEGIAISDTQGRVLRVNAEFVRMFGYGADEAVGQCLDDLVAPPARREEARALTASATQGSEILLETVRRRKDGTLVDVSLISTSILVAGKPEALYAIYRDITERKQAEEETEHERAFFDRLVETAPEGIAITGAQGRVLRVNAEFVRMFGYGVDEAVGRSIDDLVAPPGREEEARTITRSVGEGKTTLLETVRRRKDGTLVDVSLIVAPIVIAGKQEAVYAIYRDITERKQAEQKLEEMATHDFLTGLPNRRLLLDRFTIAAALAHRNKTRLAVMSLDLDKFKSINDTLGHDAGDQVLKVISARLVRILRASDTFARVGGDEFISVMMETDHIEEATAIANKILDSFTEPLSIAGHQLHLSTSIGIAIYPDDAEDLETLTKKSDAAMYYSKSHGRNQFKFYSDGDVQIG